MRATFIKHLRNKRLAKAAPEVGMERTPSRVQSIHESLYSNRMTFLNRAARRIGFSRKVVMEHSEMQRFSSIQAAQEMQRESESACGGGAAALPDVDARAVTTAHKRGRASFSLSLPHPQALTRLSQAPAPAS